LLPHLLNAVWLDPVPLAETQRSERVQLSRLCAQPRSGTGAWRTYRVSVRPSIATMRNFAPLWRTFAAAWFAGESYQRRTASTLGNCRIAMQQGVGPSPSSSVLR